MGRLTNAERERAVGMILAGTSKVNIARLFGCSHVTIHALWNRYQQTGSVADRQRPGHPRVTTPRDDRRIRLTHLRNRFQTARATSRTLFGGRVSEKTIRNRLRANNLRCRRPYRGTVLTRRHRNNRLRWAQNRATWNQRRWNRVLFSDESRFNVSLADGRARIWRRPRERFADCCVMERDPYGAGSVMIWGGICGNQKTRLLVIRNNLTARRYIDDVLTPEVIPYLARHGPGLTFQQDNATPHTARITQNFLNVNGVNVLPWPAKSPDLNPIEHLWDELGRRVRQRANPPQNVPQLERALVAEWRRLPMRSIRRLTQSMTRRCHAVIRARGSHTRY